MTIQQKLKQREIETTDWALKKDIYWAGICSKDYKSFIELDCPVCKSVNIIDHEGKMSGVHKCWNCEGEIQWGEPKELSTCY
jgi:phage FluMu protein Com